MADLGEGERLTGRSRPDREQVVDEVFADVDCGERKIRNIGAEVDLVLEGGQARNRGLLFAPLRRGLKPRPMTNVKL